MSRSRQVVLAWLPAALYMAAIWGVSSFTFDAPLVNEFPLRDKGIHFVEYAVLGFLVAHAALRTWPDRNAVRAVALGALVAAAWGVLDELHQALVPGRTAELLDLLADTLGSVAGASFRLGVRQMAALRQSQTASSGEKS